MKQELKQSITKSCAALAAALCMCMALAPGLAIADDTPSYTPGELASSDAAAPADGITFTIQGPDDLSLTYGYVESATDGALSVAPTVKGADNYDYEITYQWYRNTKESNEGGTAIKDATSDSYTIPRGMSAGEYYYYCVADLVATEKKAASADSTTDSSASASSATDESKSDEVTKSVVSEAATLTVEKADQDAPKSPSAVNVTIKGKKDGMLQGVSEDMEYRLASTETTSDSEGDADAALDDDAVWTDCKGASVSGLSTGTYEVRYKETENYNESEATELIVNWDATSSITIGSNAPTVTSDNLDEVALGYKRSSQIDSNTTVALDLNVSAVSNPQNNADAKKIMAIAAGKDLAYFDLTIKCSLNSERPETLTDLGSNVAVINVPFTTKDRDNITAYRVHDGKASALRALSQKPTSGFLDGTYYVGDGSVTIYSSKFSVYALGFDSKTAANETKGASTMPATGDTLPPVAVIGAIVVLAIVAMVVARRFIKRA